MNLGQIYTKPQVAAYMSSLFSLPEGSKILDPCFGFGAFIEALISQGKYQITGIDIDAESYRYCDNKYGDRAELIQADLFSLTPTELYDGIIINPPYVRQEEIDDLKEKFGISKSKLKQKIKYELDSKSNLYMYFLLYALSFLKLGGEMIAIFPNSWRKAKIGKKFLEALNSFCTIEHLIQIEGNPFEGDPMVEVDILKITKGHSAGEPLSGWLTVKDSEVLYSESANRANTEFSNVIALNKVASVRRGISTGYNKVFVNPSLFDHSHFKPIVCSPKDIPGFTTSRAKLSNLLAISPSDTLSEEESSYFEDCAQVIVENKEPKSLYQLICNGKPWYYLPSDKVGDILFPYIIRASIRFIINDGHQLARDNFYTISTEIDSLLLLALLNNHFVWYQLELLGKSYGNNMLKIQKYDVDQLYIVDPQKLTHEDTQQLIGLAQKLIQTNDTAVIENITEIVASYINCPDIINRYEQENAHRFSK